VRVLRVGMVDWQFVNVEWLLLFDEFVICDLLFVRGVWLSVVWQLPIWDCILVIGYW